MFGPKLAARDYAIFILTSITILLGVKLMSQTDDDYYPREDVAERLGDAQAKATAQIARAVQQVAVSNKEIAQSNQAIANSLDKLASAVSQLEFNITVPTEQAAAQPGAQTQQQTGTTGGTQGQRTGELQGVLEME